MKGAAATIDHALHALRTAVDRGLLLRSVMGAGLLGWAVVFAFYLERIALAPSARPALALLLVACFHLRAHVTARVASAVVASRLPEAMVPTAPRALDVARTANVVLLGHLALCALPVAAAYLEELLVPFAFLPFALRGATVGTWLARAGAAPEGGFAALRRARRDLAGARLRGVLVEAMFLVGTLALAMNFLGVAGGALALARSVFGVDAVAWRVVVGDPFAWLVAVVVAAAVLDPLRAAVSALVYVEARARHEGFDLDVALQRVLGGRGVALLVGLLVLGGATGAHAEAPLASTQAGRDEAVDVAVEAALARPEFVDPVGTESYGLLERLLRWLAELAHEERPEPPVTPSMFSAPPAWTLAVTAIALALLVVFLAVSSRRARRAGSDEAPPNEDDPRGRPAEDHLAVAARLAAEGAHREALRALYLATLVALDTQGLIAFDRYRTNRYYLRGMREGSAREDFRSFTELFDRKWYGDQATSAGDYLDGRALAERLCRAPEVEG
jgi:hypothetical protein